MDRIAIMFVLGLLPLLPSCHSVKDPFHKKSASTISFQGNLPRLDLGSLLRTPRGSASSEFRALQQMISSGVSPDGRFLTPYDQEAIALRLAILESRLGLTQKSDSALWKIRKTTNDPWTRSLAQALQAWCLLEGGKTQKAQFVLNKISALEKARLEPLISQMARRIRISEPSAPLPPAPKSPGRIAILPRKSWGNSPAIPGKMKAMGKPTRLTIHHAGIEVPHSPEEAIQQIRQFQKNQMRQKGWGDIGYHFLIDPWGNIFEGRRLKFQGAHAGDGRTNKHNIGICLLGNFQPGKAGASHPTQAQLQSMRALVGILSDTFNIPPSQVFSHQQIRPTATFCPGAWLLPEIQRLKKDLAVHRLMEEKRQSDPTGTKGYGRPNLGG